jgi:hypothetical protein
MHIEARIIVRRRGSVISTDPWVVGSFFGGSVRVETLRNGTVLFLS